MTKLHQEPPRSWRVPLRMLEPVAHQSASWSLWKWSCFPSALPWAWNMVLAIQEVLQPSHWRASNHLANLLKRCHVPENSTFMWNRPTTTRRSHPEVLKFDLFLWVWSGTLPGYLTLIPRVFNASPWSLMMSHHTLDVHFARTFWSLYPFQICLASASVCASPHAFSMLLICFG